MNEKKASFLSVWILLAGLGATAAAVLWACLDSRAALPDLVGRTLTERETEEVIARNSPLIDYVYLSPNADFPRADGIKKITIHHMAEELTLERLGTVFGNRDRQASSNYAVDTDGRVALYVEERDRAWTSSSKENDDQAVTIEVANDRMGGDWHVSDEAYAALVELCTDICRRNSIPELTYTGDAGGTLTTHRMFRPETECPGPYLAGRMEELAREVNRRLAEEG